MARKPADQSVNREEIILAAADVLHRNGYESTTMKDIAAEVNLTAASLYHHFRNKDTLLLAVLEIGLGQVIKRLEPIVHANQSNTDKLTEMIRVHISSLTRNTSVGAAMIFEIRPLMSLKTNARTGSKAYKDFIDRRNAFFRQRDYFEDLFRCVVRDGIDAGEFHPVDVNIFVKGLLGGNNWVAVWYREDGRLDGERIAEMMATNALRALTME